MRSVSPAGATATDKPLLKKDDPKELVEILNKVPVKQLKEKEWCSLLSLQLFPKAVAKIASSFPIRRSARRSAKFT